MTRPVAIITGAARRIGAALTEELADLGYDILLHHHRSVADAQALAARLSDRARVEPFAADLADPDALATIIPAAMNRFGRVDVLVNNASLFQHDDLPGLTRALWDKHLAVNVTAPVFLIRDFAAACDAAGVVVNILDQKVMNPNPDHLSYTAGKVALHGMMRPLALALSPKVRINAIAPGVTFPSGQQTQADFDRAAAATPSGVSSTPADLRRALRFILQTPAMNGHTLVVDGGESLLNRTRDVANDV